MKRFSFRKEKCPPNPPSCGKKRIFPANCFSLKKERRPPDPPRMRKKIGLPRKNVSFAKATCPGSAPKVKKRGRQWFWLGLIVLLLLLFCAYRLYAQPGLGNADPAALAKSATLNTLNAKTLHFTTKAQLALNGELRNFNDIQGDKAGENRFHIYGQILGTTVNVYQIDTTTYRQDSLDGKWHIIEQNDVASQSLLMAELNPLNDFYFEDIPKAKFLSKDAKQKADREALAIVECQPLLANQWIRQNFQDITYTLWIAKGNTPYIVKATIDANSKDNPKAHLQIQLTFSDFNKTITLTPPVTYGK